VDSHILFSNSPFGRGDFTINFFYENARQSRSAQLACPFFTTAVPLRLLHDAGCSRIQLLVRLCESTTPNALREARNQQNVNVRFFTSDAFHAKFYVLGAVALVARFN
jgi:hypothetical protein